MLSATFKNWVGRCDAGQAVRNRRGHGGAFILIEILSIIPAIVGVSIIDWIPIVVPTLIYTVLFIITNGLIAPIAAHAFHDGFIVLIILFQYVS